MPTTWGYGAAGPEPGTMSGWGYPTRLPLTETAPFEILFNVVRPNPSLSVKLPAPNFTVERPASGMSVKRPAVSVEVTRPAIDVVVK